MANYITNIPGSTIDQYLQEGHEAFSKANSAVKTLGNTQTATAVTILGATSTIMPVATQIPAATTTKAGVMSAADKTKLDALGAPDGDTINKNADGEIKVNISGIVDDETTYVSNGKVKVAVDGETILADEDGIKLNLSKTATTSANGLMSAADKTKLDNAEPAHFIATYGTTTYAELAAAKAKGCLLLCQYGGILYTNVNETTSFPFHFTNVRNEDNGSLLVRWVKIGSTGSWSSGAYDVASKTDVRQKYINAGATYNAITGLYSLNGLTDITEAQMSVIYEDTYRKQCGKDLSYLFYGGNARTNFSPRNRGTYENGLTCLDLCYCRKMEVFKWGPEYRSGESDNYYGIISNATEMFNGCIALKKIIGVLNISGVTATPSSMFANCNVLEDVQILGLKVSLALTSPVISHDSLMFLVEHAANTSAITVKVHQDVWAKISSAEWNDIYVAATDKNIEFVANN